ncbi:MAG: PilZ domain-containing protein [Emcibacter sp.]|nr:PilZ domain-containing protein [Emcibacter sp.]
MRNEEKSGVGVRSILSSMRKHNRKTVVQTATIKVDGFYFDCTAYDVSLGGIRLKVDIPIKSGTSVLIQMRNKLKQAARVIWTADGFMGLRFIESPERVKVGLGVMASGLS